MHNGILSLNQRKPKNYLVDTRIYSSARCGKRVFFLGALAVVFYGTVLRTTDCKGESRGHTKTQAAEFSSFTQDFWDVREPDDYLARASFSSRHPSGAERQAMNQFVRDTIGVFFHTGPSTDDVLTLIEQAVTDEELSARIRKMAFERSTGVDIYMELASPFSSRKDELQAGLERFLRETKEAFLQRKPSVDEIKEIEERSIRSLDLKIEWMRGGLRYVNSLDTFLKLTEFSSRAPTEDYRKAMDGFIRESLGSLVEKGILNLGEYKLLEAQCARSPDTHLAFLRSGLPLVRSAEDFVQLARFTDDRPSQEYRSVRNAFIRENHEIFLSKRPTAGQIGRVLLSVSDAVVAAELTGAGLELGLSQMRRSLPELMH